MNRGLCFPFLVLMLLQLNAYGQPATEKFAELYPASFTVYNTDRGMPINCTEQVFIDHKGRLWVSPCRYLAFYPNLSFYQYNGVKSNVFNLKLPGENVGSYGWNLTGLTDGGLLFGLDSRDTCILLFDPDSAESTFYPFGGASNISNEVAGPGKVVYALVQYPDTLSLYSLAPEGKKLLVQLPGNIADADNKFYIPVQRFNDVLWIYYGSKGIVRYSLSDNSSKIYHWREVLGSAIPQQPSFSAQPGNLEMIVEDNGHLLIYLRTLGAFFVFDPESGNVFPQKQLNAYFKQSKIPPGAYVDFHKDSKGNILVGFAWDLRVSIRSYKDCTSFALLDRYGRVFNYCQVGWLAAPDNSSKSRGYFLSKGDFKKNLLIASQEGLIAVEVKEDWAITPFLKKQPIRAMAELEQTRVLVLSENGDKNIIDLETGTTTLASTTQGSAPFYMVRNYAQLVSRKNLLWFPTKDGMLGCYERKGRDFRYFHIGQFFDKFNFINEREIALVTAENVLFRYDLSRDSLWPVVQNGAPLQIGGKPNEVYTDHQGIVWVASLNGLWRYDPARGEVKRIGQTEGLKDEGILCIYEAPNKKLWLGTLNAGILIYEPETGAIQVINQSNGLSNNSVTGILADKQGNCWASTFNGITVVSAEGKVLFEVSENEGLSHREFNRFSYLKTEDGRLLFGSISGVSMLDPEKIIATFSKKEPVNLYLTRLSYYDNARDQEITRTSHFDQLKTIELPAKHRYIKLDFGLSDFIDPEKCTYAYRFDFTEKTGAETEDDGLWTSIGSNPELFLNNLPVGKYRILIRGMNAKGQRAETLISIPVNVQEFFYFTWWFYLLCTLPFLLLAYFIIRHLMTERQRLEIEVATRTEKIQQDKRLIEQQAADLQELDKLKSRFFTNISHEFRTPLTIISGMITQIQHQPERWLEKGIELIQRNSRQLLSLVNQILDLRKLETGNVKLQLVQADILPYLHYIVDAFIPMAQGKGIRIHFLAEQTKINMDYDAGKMLQILSNLLSNAVKYTPGPGDIYVQVAHRTSGDSGEQLLIQVKDTGPGISPEALPFIFNQFYQVENPASQITQGSGVGLALTKELVQLMHGTIEVQSNLGKGTIFSMVFPISREASKMEHDFSAIPRDSTMPETFSTMVVKETFAPETQESMEQRSTELWNAPETHNPALLIVEDNADVRLYLKAILAEGYDLLLAENGQEGIDMAIEQVPDIVISDVMMPVKDGFTLCDTLKNDPRTSHIPIVLLTAKADFQSKIDGLRKGADAYLTKPFEPEELMVRLEQLLLLRMKLQERYKGASLIGPTEQSEVFEIEDAFVQKLREQVLKHMSKDNFGIAHLCRAMGLSRTQLYCKIKALTGLSTSEYIRMIRLNKARELLQTTDMNVSEVGYEVGLSNPAYFSRLFTEAFGLAPRRTRK